MNLLPAISDCLQQLAPASALVLGAQSERIAALCLQVSPQTQVVASPDIIQKPDSGRYDIGIVADLLESLSKAEGLALIARLRDVECGHLLVAVMIGALESNAWRENDLLAMGLKRLAIESRGDDALAIYDFNLSNYKLTPDWLNNRHWANPELWGQHRW